MTDSSQYSGRISTRRIWLVAGFCAVLIGLSCCSLWTLAVGPPIPWSKRFFEPKEPLSVWDADPNWEELASRATACGLAWSATIKGTKEDQYESGPEYILYLTPMSFDDRLIRSWQLTSVQILALNGTNETIFSKPGSGPRTGDSYPHPSLEAVRIYDPAKLLLGTLDSVRPGESIEVIAEVEVEFITDEPVCIDRVRIAFDCLRDSGWIRIYR